MNEALQHEAAADTPEETITPEPTAPQKLPWTPPRILELDTEETANGTVDGADFGTFT